MKIEYIHESESKALWGDKAAVLKRYEGLNIYTLNRWISEMRKNKQFKKGVVNPTHKLVWINFEVFSEFLYWKQHGYSRSRNKNKKMIK